MTLDNELVKQIKEELEGAKIAEMKAQADMQTLYQKQGITIISHSQFSIDINLL